MPDPITPVIPAAAVTAIMGGAFSLGESAVLPAAIYIPSAIAWTTPAILVSAVVYEDWMLEQRIPLDYAMEHANQRKPTGSLDMQQRQERASWEAAMILENQRAINAAAANQKAKEDWAAARGMTVKQYRSMFYGYTRTARVLHNNAWHPYVNTIFLPKNKPGDQFRRIRRGQ